jgi:hypothetical protein
MSLPSLFLLSPYLLSQCNPWDWNDNTV